MPLIQYGQVQAGTAIDLIRITEQSDTRITESGDTRITVTELQNQIEARLVVAPTLIVPFRQLSYKESGTWQVVIPYVKDAGVWKQPNTIYIKQNGNWIRTL
jgi:hypothetical protein